MDNFFSEIGIRPWDFVQLSTGFLLTMLVFLGVKEKKYLWLNYLVLLTFSLQVLFFILFHDGLRIKLFAALMLLSALILEGVLIRKRQNGRGEPTSGQAGEKHRN